MRRVSSLFASRDPAPSGSGRREVSAAAERAREQFYEQFDEQFEELRVHVREEFEQIRVGIEKLLAKE
jgi:hypothetical protein